MYASPTHAIDISSIIYAIGRVTLSLNLKVRIFCTTEVSIPNELKRRIAEYMTMREFSLRSRLISSSQYETRTD
jgi:hypothetical protein